MSLRAAAGGWWVTTRKTATNVYRLYAGLNEVDPRYDNTRGFGFAMRCVKRGLRLLLY